MKNMKNRRKKTSTKIEVFSLCFFGKGNGNEGAQDHEKEPNEDQIVPADGGDRLCENGRGDRRGKVTDKVEKARSAGNKTRIRKARAINAPEHRGGAVGGENGKNHCRNVENGIFDQIQKKEKQGGGAEGNKKGQIHIFPKQLVNENGEEGIEGNAQGGNGEDPRGKS